MSLSSQRRRTTTAVAAFLLLAACLAVMGVAGGARALRRHVVVHVYNVNDYAQVFVNCRQAGAVLRPGDEATIDLGWLEPDDLVTLQARNGSGDASWGFTMWVDGKRVLDDTRGRLGTIPAGDAVHTERVVHVLTTSATGRTVGSAGCQDAAPALAGARLTHDALFHKTGGWLTMSTWLAARLRWLLVGIGILGVMWLYFTGRNTKTIWVLPLLAGWFLLSQKRFEFMFILHGVCGALLLIYIGVRLLGWRVMRDRAPAVPITSPHA